MAAGLPLHIDAIVEPEGVAQFLIDGVGAVHRHVEHLPLAGLLAVQQRDQHADMGEGRRAMIGLVATRIDRRDRMIVITAHVERPSSRQRDKVGAAIVRPRAGQAIRRHRRDDEAREAHRQGVEIERQRLQPRWLHRDDKDIGIGQQRRQRGLRAILDIPHHAALVAVVEPEGEAGVRSRPMPGKGTEGAGGRALRRLHLHHVRAHFAQHAAEKFTADILGQLYHLQPGIGCARADGSKRLHQITPSAA